MSAKKKASKQPAKTRTSKPKKQHSRNLAQWAYATTPATTSLQGWENKAYYGLLALGAVVLLTLSQVTGINADEKFQDDYATKLVDYYASGGDDQAALYIDDNSSQRYNKYYGGFFEVLTGSVNSLLGNTLGPSYHAVRHFLLALFGILLMVLVARWTREMAGVRAAIFAVLLFLASPRLLGHSVMNPKDIPFAAGYFMGAYYLYRCLVSMPKPRWQDLLGLAVGGALATSIRAGGILVFCYSGLFMAIDFLMRYGFAGIGKEFKIFGRYAGYWLGTTILGFGLALLFWPYALQAPLEHTQEALAQFSSYPVRIIILFAGENIFSDAIPTTYPLTWLGISVALSVLAGTVLGLLATPILGKRYGRLPLYLLAFTALFPLLYIMIKDSALYDGWRQLLFIYAPMLVIAALLYNSVAERLQDNTPYANYAVLGLVVLLSVDAYLYTARNPGLAYTYFNPVAGGVSGTFGEYEQDYWGLSTRQAVKWMEDEGILHPEMDTITLGTTFSYNIRRELDPTYRPKVKVRYVRYHTRFKESWDYGVFPSRFIRGAHLRNATWPGSKTIHTIEANGVPICVIEKDPEQYGMQAEQLVKQGNFAAAIPLFQQEITKYADNEQGWNGLAMAQINTGQADAAISSTDAALAIAPDNETALYLKGYAYLAKNDANTALTTFNHLLSVDPENAMAYYWMGEIYRQRNDLQTAYAQLQKAIEYNPRLKQAYLAVAEIFASQGDTENANRYRQAAAQL